MSGEEWPYAGSPTPIGTEVMPSNWPNDIQDAISVNGRGGGRSSVANATAAENTTLPNETDKVFTLVTTGAETVKYIDTTNRQPGNEITLIVSGGGCNLNNNESSAPAGYAKIYVFRDGAAGSQAVYENQRIILTYSGTAWHCDV